MADQTGENATPTFETKNLPHGYAPAAVPYTDSTVLDRDDAGAQEADTQDSTATGGEKKTTTRKSTTKDS